MSGDFMSHLTWLLGAHSSPPLHLGSSEGGQHGTLTTNWCSLLPTSVWVWSCLMLSLWHHDAGCWSGVSAWHRLDQILGLLEHIQRRATEKTGEMEQFTIYTVKYQCTKSLGGASWNWQLCSCFLISHSQNLSGRETSSSVVFNVELQLHWVQA